MNNPIKNVRFTLIELLVVIAIIAILASMLLPALSNARKTAHSSCCTNNLKQLSVIIYQYADDYNELMPPLKKESGGNPFFDYKRELITDGYLKSSGPVSNPSSSAVADRKSVV